MKENKPTIEEMKEMMKETDNAYLAEEAKQLWESDDAVDRITAIEVCREVALNSYLPSMEFMAWICHDNRGGLETQDREEECFWYEQMYQGLNHEKLLYHAQNMMNQSYDRVFPPEQINQVLELAAALGNNRSVESLAAYYSKDLEDKESLKKSLFWFYSLKDPSPEVAKRLEKVEAVLGLR